MQYFIVINDVQQGPFSIDELRQRNITSDTLVWAEGMPQWTPAWQVEELRPLFYDDAQTAQTTAAQQGPTPPPYGTQNGAQPGNTPGGSYHEPGTGGSTPPPYQPEKSNRKKVLTYVGIAVALLLLIMAITNPSKDEHRQVIKDHITAGFHRGLGGNDNSGLASLASSMISALAGPVINSAIDNLLQYHNYVFWSTTTIDIPGTGEQRTSLGIFGKVFTSDEATIAEAVAKATGDKDDEKDTTTTTIFIGGDNDGGDNGDDITTQVTDTIVSMGNKVGRTVVHRVSRDVSKEIKKEINQNADSATASGLNKIVDAVGSFLKGL
jgi:hypothetical protein